MKPKTIRGFLSFCKRTSKIELSNLKGYSDLSENQKIILGAITAEIDNLISEFENEKAN